MAIAFKHIQSSVNQKVVGLLYASLIKAAMIFLFAIQMTFMLENSQKED